MVKNGIINKGTKLEVLLKPELINGREWNFIKYPYSFTTNKYLKDNNTKNKLADLDIDNGDVKVIAIFEKIENNFTADINSELVINASELLEYFKENPSKTEVEQKYILYINGKVQNKSVNLKFKKPNIQDAEIKFTKTSGSYKKEGDLGQGNFLYNIKLGTKLRKYNEFVIYDTPDINLELKDNVKLRIPISYGGIDNRISLPYVEEGVSEEKRMEAKLYDIYYLTADSKAKNQPRMAEYEEDYIIFNRKDIVNQKDTIKSLNKVTKPKNILLEKEHGEELTIEEKAKIEQAGGLHKTVGKGFKLHIKNFKNPAFIKGGFLTLIFEMKIVNPSPLLDNDSNPLYKNTASYYGQEIPNCKPEDVNCTPIEDEKSTMEDVKKFELISNGVVKEGTIGAEVDNYSLISIVKKDNKDKTIKGAKFNIYESNANGEKVKIAINKNNESLENLVTNDLGKLCKEEADGSLKEIVLNLKRGYYVINELSAPEGYKIVKNDHFITVGFKNDETIIINEKLIKETEKETSEETSKETEKETSEETSKETEKETSEETSKETEKETSEETSKETKKETSKETPKETESEKEIKDKNDKNKENPSTGDIGIVMPIITLIISAGVSELLSKNKK